MKKRVRHHFQLLEVLIAMVLLVVCVIPVIDAYIGMNKAQFERTRLVERDHLVHLAYAKIVEALYMKKMDWPDLKHAKEEDFERLFNADDEDHVASQLKALSYKCSYQLTKEKPKVLKSTTTKFLFQLKITVQDLSKKMEDSVYQYTIFASNE